MKQADSWQRPKTTKAYLHPPFSERLVMVWPDFKITNHEFADNGKHTHQNSTGLIFLHGQDMQQMDFRQTSFAPVHDGLPVYRLNSTVDCSISMECFCNFDQNPSVYAQIHLQNNHAYAVANSISILARSGDDAYLTNIFDTGYTPYEPNVGTWYLLKRNWSHAGWQMTDGQGYISLQPDEKLQADWIADGQDKFSPCNYFRLAYTLEPGESTSLTLSQKHGCYTDTFDYQLELQRATTNWKHIQEKITRWPKTKNDMYQRMYRQLVTQSLQMLASLPGKELVVPRQGDIACFIWPWEAMHFLIPLDRIGLSDYTNKAYRYFVERWFTDGGVDDGMIKSCHQQWGNLNGAFIWGISEHLFYTRDEDAFYYYKPYLDRALDWIQRERKKSAYDCAYPGIFPIGKATDWNQLAQHWCFTDGTNVMGIGCLANLYELFGAENAGYVRAVYVEYRQVLLDIVQSLYAGHEEDRTYILPHQLGLPFEDTELYCYSICGHPYLYFSGLLDPNTRMFDQLEQYFHKNGFFKNGLAGRMTSIHPAATNLYDEMYYTVNGEMIWLKAWTERGETDKAQHMLQALLTYCLTSEFIVSERFSPRNPWFCPWQPNASSTGRMLTILLDYFGEASSFL